MARKLGAPYKLSGAASDALVDSAVSKSQRAKNAGDALRQLNNEPQEINTVEDAASASRDLSQVNKNLRAARRPR
jgi:hypothetical protein